MEELQVYFVITSHQRDRLEGLRRGTETMQDVLSRALDALEKADRLLLNRNGREL